MTAPARPPCPICGRPVMRSKAITCTATCASKRKVAIAQGKWGVTPVVVMPKMSPLQRRRFLEQGAALFAKGRM